MFYASPSDEAIALRRAAARAGCRVRRLTVKPAAIGAAPRVSSSLACADGWGAARLLLALAIEDSLTPGARALADELRAAGASDEDFARAIHAFVRARVKFTREENEEFASGARTLERGEGDCDDHFRLAFAIAMAGGLPASLGILWHGPNAPRDRQSPTHAVVLYRLARGWVFGETTVDARFGEEPNAAAARLGLTNERSDIAREVKIMTERDLPPLPAGFRERNRPEQVARDAQALQRLGYLGDGVPASMMSDPTAPVLRRAVVDFQRARGLVADGLLGPTTRLTIARALAEAGPPVTHGFYAGLSGLGDKASQPLFTHAQAREVLRTAYVRLFKRQPSDGELDFGLATAFFETFYGRGTAASWGNAGQFGTWARDGKLNWGALQSGVPGDERTMQAFVAAGLHPTKERGRDAGRPVYFYLFPNDEEAAVAFLMSWGKPDTLQAAASGSATAVSAAMKRHGYYEGFHVPPGNPRGLKVPPFIVEASAEEAERKNVEDYAAALSRHVRTVKGSGGVPDWSVAAPGGAGGGVVASVVLVGAGLALAGAAAWALS